MRVAISKQEKEREKKSDKKERQYSSLFTRFTDHKRLIIKSVCVCVCMSIHVRMCI